MSVEQTVIDTLKDGEERGYAGSMRADYLEQAAIALLREYAEELRMMGNSEVDVELNIQDTVHQSLE